MFNCGHKMLKFFTKGIPGQWACMAKNVAQTSLLIHNIVKNTKKIAMPFGILTFHLVHVFVTTKQADNLIIQLVNLLAGTTLLLRLVVDYLYGKM